MINQCNHKCNNVGICLECFETPRRYRFKTKGYSFISNGSVGVNGVLYGICPTGHYFQTTFSNYVKSRLSLLCDKCNFKSSSLSQ